MKKSALGADTLLPRIKKYKKMAAEISAFLEKNPGEWGKYQSDFNQEINAIFRELMLFEKDSLARDQEEQLYKLKNFFIHKLRSEFVHGDLIRWSLEKPYGYAGDFRVIDEIYKNAPQTKAYARLFDNYFQMSVISIAVRNRKEDFKKIVTGYAAENAGKPLRILDIASGPCRDIYELLGNDPKGLFKKADITCLDADKKAIEYAGNLLNHDPRVQFIQMNIVKLALTKDPLKDFKTKFDVIYTTGLFDYLDERISVRLIKNLKEILNPGGVLAIADVRDKFSNPSIYFMEWVGDWNLIYRNDDEFRSFFIDAGFNPARLDYQYEQQGVIQYVIARH